MEYESLWAFTAACPATGQAVGLIAPRADTEATNVFLGMMSAALEPGVHAVLVWDNAGFHTSRSLVVPANITLLALPPYSPELNPVERLWLSLREHYWSNRVYADVDAVESAAMSGWRAVCLDGAKFRSICRCEYPSERS